MPPTFENRKALLELVMTLIDRKKIVFASTKNPLCFVARDADNTFTLYRAAAAAKYTLGIQTPGLSLWVRSTDTNTNGLFWKMLNTISEHEDQVAAPQLIAHLKKHYGVN